MWLWCTCAYLRTPSVYAATHGYPVPRYLQVIAVSLQMQLRLVGFGSVAHAGLMPTVVPNMPLHEQS